MANQKKRILFIQTQAENAGAQEISRLLGEGLTARGHDVHHLFFYQKSDTFNAPKQTIIFCEKRPSSPLAFLKFYKDLIVKIRSLKPDCVFTFQHFGNVMGAPAAKLAGQKSVVANQVSARETIHPLLRKLDLWLGLSPVYQNITVNSESLKQDYASYPEAYVKKLLMLPHGFEDKTVAITKDEARKHLKLEGFGKLIGTAARLNPMKQIDLAINLLKQQPDWRLAIAGQGPDEERLKKHAQKLDIADRVLFLGEKAPEEVGIFLKSLDAFVFPSMAETFGLAAVEAAQAGLPVIANDLPVLREVLKVEGQDAALFVDVKNGAAFEEALLSVFEDQKKQDDLRTAGLRLRDKYSLDKMIDAYEEMALNKPLDKWRCSQ